MLEKALLKRTESRRFWVLLRQVAILALLFFGLRRLYSVNRHYTDRRHPSKSMATTYPPRRGYEILQRDSWVKLTEALDSARPRLSTALHVTKKVPGQPIEKMLEEEEDVDAISLDFKTVASLNIRHTRFVKAVKDKTIPLIYRESKRGIVVAATAENLPAILVQLRLLRRTRSNLRVDVFLLTEDDYDDVICNEILPSYHARCRVLETLMSKSPLPFVHDRRVRRQIVANEPLHKLLAVFFSDFEDNLVLGHDTLVYNMPDMSFKQEPYLSRGLVMWPDFWASSISPKISKVQGKQVPNTIDKRSTIDMGQMMISKVSAREALLLSIYYTYYGPGLYDVLLKQSDVGEAGSQAIKAAARYFDMHFYMVKRLVEAVGYPDLDVAGQPFRGVAMLQSYAQEDYFRLSKDKHVPAFIHANNPVLDPTKILQQGVTSFKQSANVTEHRMWEWFGGRYSSNGWRDPDPEQALWAEMAKVQCVDLAKIPSYSATSAQSCQEIQEHMLQMGFRHDVLY